ncbi:MAG: hypothetical protein ACRCZI_13805 [Cetobacterium sp.]
MADLEPNQPPSEQQIESFFTEVLEITDQALLLELHSQGLKSMSGFNQHTEHEIALICQNIRRPGGTVEDDEGNTHPDRGVQVSVLDEKRLKQFWYYCRYCYMTQRIPNFGDAQQVPSLDALQQLDAYVLTFPAPRDVVKPVQFPGFDKARRWYESFEEWAAQSIGPSGVPLSYVLRESREQVNPGDLGIFCESMDDDLFRMSRQNTPGSMFWLADNTMVWNQLRECFHPTKDYTWIKPFEKSKDGHGGYLAGKKHALGPGVTRTMHASAEKVLASTRYDGRNKSWTFDKVVTRLNEAFDNSALEWDDTQKVIKLLDCITDNLLLPVKLSIRANDALRIDYAGTVAYILEQITMMGHESNSNRNIGAYNIPRKGPGRGGNRTHPAARAGRSLHRTPGLESWDPERPGAYYSRACYATLTAEQKQLNYESREVNPNKSTKGNDAKRAATLSKVESAKNDLMTAKLDFLMSAVVGKGLVVPPMAMISSVGTTPSTISETSVGASLKRKAPEQKAKFYELVGKSLVPRYDID